LSHKALARKYRPRSFADVATQEHVSETLRRAVSAGRTGHAYLFCGPRGVGKTTLARVLAMALNCPDRTEEGEPCGVCESCARIWGGHTALDVVEIDAASNRGVDDARDLRERAMYAPSAEGRTKVYIIDEAHMLTREAWNALLKILEEPPPRVVFVFATTEPQKINQFAAPILSRCQRFDFRRIGVADIVSRLRRVLDQEGSGAADEALRIIARKADGGLRDALSILDQVISLTGGDVDAASVRRVLGLVEEDRYLELLDILRDQRHGDVFVLVEGLIDEGYDLVEFYHGLLDTLRALLRLRLSPDAPLDLPEGVHAQLLERAASFQPGDLVRMLASAAELENQGSLRRSPNPRLPIEMLLLRMSFLDRTVDIEELIRALGGAPPRLSGTPHHEDAAPPGAEGSSPGGGGPGRKRRGGPPAVSVPEPTDAGGPRPDRRAPAGTAGGDSPAEIEPSASAAEGWARWLEAASTVPAGLGPFLRSAAVTEGADGSIEVSMPAGPAVERLGRAAVIDQMRSGLTPYLGRAPVLVIRTREEPKVGAGRLTEEAVREDTLRALYRQEPRLRRAVEELDLELMD
jgi:DNA polymerase-3 subunit gamma/tau